MEMHGELRIAAPREQVWERLNDPETLKICIPGCQTVERTSDNEFTAKVVATVALEEDGAETILRYGVNAQVGGKLAQIGSRLVDATARKMSDEFFKSFVGARSE